MGEAAVLDQSAPGATTGARRITQWLIVIGCALFFAGAALVFVPYEDPRFPHGGDVITPQFAAEPLFRADESAWIRIRLHATNREGTPRILDFAPSPAEAPRATVIFRDAAGSPIQQSEVDRWGVCCYGVMTNRNVIHVPAHAHSASLSVAVPRFQKGIVTHKLERSSIQVVRE